MDEERRTTLNLKACIDAVADRVVFINTGFLDRTGDEIHTSMEAGPMIRKGAMKTHVDPGLRGRQRRRRSGHGLLGQGADRQGHVGHARADGRDARPEDRPPEGRATTAWVPSPTAATLHAMHYHGVDVFKVQKELEGEPRTTSTSCSPSRLPRSWRGAEKSAKKSTTTASRSSATSCAGSTRASAARRCPISPTSRRWRTAPRCASRASSGELAAARVVTTDQVMASLKRMAAVVDRQNAGDPDFRRWPRRGAPRVPGRGGPDPVGPRQPNGYTEPILHRRRREVKAANTASNGKTQPGSSQCR